MDSLAMLRLVKLCRTSGNNLVGLWRPSLVRDRHLLYSIGGGGVTLEGVQQLDLRTGIWTTIKAIGSTPPIDLHGHTAVLWRNYIVVFGGYDNKEFYNRVILFNLNDHTWHCPTVRGPHVIARYLHTAVVYNDKMYTYGGFAKNPERTYVLTHLMALDLNTFTWEKPCVVPPRYNHSALLIGDRMYIYAGKNGSGKTVTDLCAVDLRLNKLLPQPGITGDIEPLKSYHFTEYIGDNRILIFGKFLKPSQEVGHSTWILDINTLVCRRLPNENYLDNGLWSYFTTVTAEELGETSANTGDPKQRRLVYDHFQDLLIVDIEPTGVWQIPHLSMEYDFSQLFESSELCDFTLKPADGKPIGVHRADASTDQVIGVLGMAGLYLLPRLTKLCCRRLAEKHLTIMTAARIFEASILVNECGLKLIALEYIFRNFGRIWHSRTLDHLSDEVMSELRDSIPADSELVVRKDITPTSSTSTQTNTSSLASRSSATPANASTSPLVAAATLPTGLPVDAGQTTTTTTPRRMSRGSPIIALPSQQQQQHHQHQQQQRQQEENGNNANADTDIMMMTNKEQLLVLSPEEQPLLQPTQEEQILLLQPHEPRLLSQQSARSSSSGTSSYSRNSRNSLNTHSHHREDMTDRTSGNLRRTMQFTLLNERLEYTRTPTPPTMMDE
ncbi:hypothetical protein BDF22DRAFT_672260 [Syncephalis plumigaleata]|nr:hypothetical protein BDF22DRAFT_672260 [Syncephalis plumigaleata]